MEPSRTLVVREVSGQSPSFVTFCESNAKALLSATPTKMQPASGFCALPGASCPLDSIPSLRTGRLFAALLPPLSGSLPTAQHCNVYNFCNLAIFKNAIPRLQNSNTLHCCAVALLARPSLSNFIQFPVPCIVYPLCPDA